MVNFSLVTACASVTLFFGLFRLINALNIDFYYDYSLRTISIVIFSPTTDFWIWVATLFFIVSETLLWVALHHQNSSQTLLFSSVLIVLLASLLVNTEAATLFGALLGLAAVALSIYYGDGYLVATRKKAALLTLASTASLLGVLEAASATSWILNAFDYEAPFTSGARWIFPSLDLQLFNVLYPLTSWLFLAFLYSWIWIPALKLAIPRVKHLRHSAKADTSLPVQKAVSDFRLKNWHLALGLSLSSAAAVFVTGYSYLHLPKTALIGSDTVEYYNWLNQMTHQGLFTVLGRDRPLTNLIMYIIQLGTGAPSSVVVRIMPAVLALCLSLVVFWVVKAGVKNERVALLASLFSAFSFQTTVGFYAYFLANWLATIESLLLTVFLLKSLEKHSWKYASISALMGMTVLLTHPYTWDVLMAVLVGFLAWTFFSAKSNRKAESTIPLLLLASNLAFYFAYSAAPFGTGVSSAARGTLQNLPVSLSNLPNIQSNLASMVQAWVGGLFANPLLILLAIAGVFSMFSFAKKFNRLMMIWIFVPSLAILVVSPDPYIYRFIYLIPLQIQAAAGLEWALSKVESLYGQLETNRTLLRAVEISITVLILLLFLNYALRSVDEAVVNLI